MARRPAPPTSGRGRASPYPFKRWKVNQTKRYPLEEYQKIRNAVQNLNRAKNGRWSYEKRYEQGTVYVRVWRVE